MYKNIKYKQTVFILAFIVIISVLFISCSAGRETESVDLSDIEDMNIGAEMPEIIYADNDDMILSGTFGIIRFNINEEKVTQRITFDNFDELRNDMLDYSVSKDGKKIFITLIEQEKYYEYKLKSGKLKPVNRIEDDLFTVLPLSMDYQIRISENTGGGYLMSNTYAEKDDSIIFLRAEDNWQMKTLQFVEYDIVDNKERKVIDVFK